MAGDLPGIYYNAEKNRYFPIKGPIPGSRRMTASASSSALTPAKANNSCRRTSVSTSKMLQARELCGNLIPFNKWRCKVNEEFQKAKACHPVVKLYRQRQNPKRSCTILRGECDSDTSLQLGVDPSEIFVMSGGEDCNLRLRSIKSGKLLFEDKLCNTIPSTVHWRRAENTV